MHLFLKQVISLIVDYDRTNCYNRFLKENAKNKVVIDCGAGSGILSWLALKHGAKEAHALEIVPATLEHLEKLVTVTPNLYVKCVDVLTEDLPKGNLYVHEMFGNTIFDEGLHYLVSNLKRQGIDNLYPNKIKIYSLSTTNKNIKLRKFNKEIHKFNLDMLDSEVREFIEILECNFYGKLNFLELLELVSAKVQEEIVNFEKTIILEKDLFEFSVTDLPLIKDDFMSWGFYFDNSIGLDLDTCNLTTWSQFLKTDEYKRNVRNILPTKNYNYKDQRLRIYDQLLDF